MAAAQAHTGDVLDDVDQLIDRDQFGATEVDRLDRRPFMIICVPCTQSSMYMKLRVWWPSPQISISSVPSRTASVTLRQMAAGAFSRPPANVP